MKSKIVFLSAMSAVILISVFFYRVEDSGRKGRYHQHIQAQQPREDEAAEGFYTHLPILKIETEGQTVPGEYIHDENGKLLGYVTSENGESEINVGFTVIDHKKKFNHPDDKPDIEARALIRYRGNSSRRFDKKSYAVHLVDENGEEDPKKVMGMSPQDEWVLNGPFLDRTLIRNYLCYNISGEIMEYAPNARYCEVFLDGEYQGVYLMVESIVKDQNRINITTPEDGKARTSYLVRWDRKGKGDEPIENFTYYTYLSSVSGLDVRYPGKNKITPERLEYIEKDISKIEKSLYSFDITDKKKGYANYLDRRAFAQYFVINEFFRNVDAGRFSTFYYKDVREKMKPCVWDFNNACDNYIDYEWAEDGFTLPDSPWFGMLVRDPDFVDEVVNVYRQLRKTWLKERYLIHYIDEVREYLGPAVDRNYQVWGYVFQPEKADGRNYLTPIERNVLSYDGAIEQLKNFIRIRGRWLDNHIETLYQYCHESKNKELFLK